MQSIQNIPNPDIESARKNEEFDDHSASDQAPQNIKESVEGIEDKPIPQPAPYPGQFPDEFDIV